MNHRSFLFPAFLLLSCLGLSCAPKSIGIDLTRTPPEEIIRRVKLHNHEMTTFRASGTISIESREFVGTGSITVSIKRPDSILIKIEGPFGIDIGSMLLTKERFTYYDSYSNRVITGATTNRNIRSLLRVDLDFAEVMDFLSGRSSIDSQDAPPDSIALENDEIQLLFARGRSRARYWIDPENYLVVRYELLDNRAEPILEARFERFSQFSELHVARSISIMAHKEHRGLSLYYNEIDINKPRLDFTLTIPEKAKRIQW